MENIFNQAPFQCRMDWGVRGVREASERGDIIVVVDVLSFSSAITNALNKGVIIYPFPRVGDIETFGKNTGAEVCILERSRARELGLPSLSSTSFTEAHRGKKYVLSSINGATCVKEAKEGSLIFVSSLLNRSAVAKVINQIQKEKEHAVTVIASGERWKRIDGQERELRPSIEDYLGAGALLEKLEGTKSPEARVCVAAFQSCRPDLSALMLDCSSAREVVSMGFPEDIPFCSQLDIYNEVPFLTKDEKGYSYFVDYRNR
jgi:2-phosphosulfolactate phosphatase